jgi:hypothetical protein
LFKEGNYQPLLPFVGRLLKKIKRKILNKKDNHKKYRHANRKIKNKNKDIKKEYI